MATPMLLRPTFTTASDVYRGLATQAERRGIDPSPFKRAEVEIRREEMRRVLRVVAGGLRKEGKRR